jgi:hypothetical protein
MPTVVRHPKQLHLDGLPVLYPHAAGMDIGSDEIVVAVPSDRDPQPVRAFATFTPDLQALVDWLQECQIDTVALESTVGPTHLILRVRQHFAGLRSIAVPLPSRHRPIQHGDVWYEY